MPAALGCVAVAGAGRQAVSVSHARPPCNIHKVCITDFHQAAIALSAFAEGCPAGTSMTQKGRHACTAP